MKNKKSNIKKRTKNPSAYKGVPDDNDEWCQAFKDKCDREIIEKLANELNTKYNDSEKLNEMVQAKLAEEFQNREKVEDSLENVAVIVMINMIRKYHGEIMAKDSKILTLEEQNAKLKASSKEVSKVLEQKQLEAKSQLKLKNDQKRELEEKIKKLEKPKQEECPICYEPISVDRKWTAFIPCGHRTCSECADKISALPRSTNKRKCPNCRGNIIGFLDLEGIYES